MPAWSGLFDGVYNAPYALLNEAGARLRGVARLFATQDAVAEGEIGVMLTGAAVGQTAQATVKQVQALQADGMNQGGQRVIDTTTVINRVTTSADEARFDAAFQPTFAPTSYPADKSGNGGGGKAGTL